MKFLSPLLALLLFLVDHNIITSTHARTTNLSEAAHASSVVKRFSGFLSQFRPGVSVVLSWLGLRPNAPPPTRVKVNVVGLGRTGTTSLAAALDTLGYHVVHDEETGSLWDLYGAYYSGEIDEDRLHERIGDRGYDVLFRFNTYKWASRHEDVKVILTTRDDVDKWVRSWLEVARLGDLLERPPFSWVPSARALVPLRRDLWKVVPTGGHPEEYLNPEYLRKGYELHARRVRATVPKERLLVFNVKEGWEPLCEFLEVPVPDTPFPFINDKAKVRGMMLCYDIMTTVFSIWPVYLAVICWYACNSMSRKSPNQLRCQIKEKKT